MGTLIGSKVTATLLAWIVFIVFCGAIGFGWYFLLLPRAGIFAAPPAAGLTLLAAIFARQIARFRATAIRAGETPRWHTGWKPYLFLAIISALGTLNAAFVLFESRAILRDDIDTVRDRYDRLRDRAHVRLPSPAYDEKRARLEGYLRNLHEEIVNPNGGNFCGVGDEARKIIAEIRILLPAYKTLNGSGVIKPCDDGRADRVYQSYDRIAHEMIAADPAFLAVNGPAKAQFLAALDKRHAAMRQALGVLERGASGYGATDGLDRQPLNDARSGYNADRRTFFSLDGREHDDLRAIGALQSDDVSSYASTLTLFWRRLGSFRTWLYLALALAIDYVAIYLLTELAARYRRDDAVDDEDEARLILFRTDPRFLWVNPMPAAGGRR